MVTDSIKVALLFGTLDSVVVRINLCPKRNM